MLKQALAGVVAVTALGAAAVIALTAGAIALYFALEPGVGRAGAAAIVAGIYALVVGLALVAILSRHSRAPEPVNHDTGMISTLLDMAKDRPLMSIAAAVAATVIAFRNPTLVATIVAAFMSRDKTNN